MLLGLLAQAFPVTHLRVLAVDQHVFVDSEVDMGCLQPRPFICLMLSLVESFKEVCSCRLDGLSQVDMPFPFGPFTVPCWCASLKCIAGRADNDVLFTSAPWLPMEFLVQSYAP